MLSSRVIFSVPFSSICCMWPAHCIVCNIITFYVFACSDITYNSLLYCQCIRDKTRVRIGESVYWISTSRNYS
jgi:hypothetical protein